LSPPPERWFESGVRQQRTVRNNSRCSRSSNRSQMSQNGSRTQTRSCFASVPSSSWSQNIRLASSHFWGGQMSTSAWFRWSGPAHSRVLPMGESQGVCQWTIINHARPFLVCYCRRWNAKGRISDVVMQLINEAHSETIFRNVWSVDHSQFLMRLEIRSLFQASEIEYEMPLPPPKSRVDDQTHWAYSKHSVAFLFIVWDLSFRLVKFSTLHIFVDFSNSFTIWLFLRAFWDHRVSPPILHESAVFGLKIHINWIGASFSGCDTVKSQSSAVW
jgi:hypothetical protein